MPTSLSRSSTPSILRLAFALLLVGFSMACGRAETGAIRNVVFIVVDTLRWDHVGAYGYARNTSPSIDALSAEGVRFDRAYATSGWTAPSVASMFTSLYPSVHGLVRPLSGLSDETPSLPEILRDQCIRKTSCLFGKGR